jgi:hypothetical protein
MEWEISMDESDESKELVMEDPIQGFEIPMWFRALSSLVALCLIFLPTAFIVLYARFPSQYESPNSLGLVPLILAGTAILLFSLAPWKAFGMRIRKVGFLEFERVMSGQASEMAIELTELRARVDELETKVHGQDSVGPITDHFEAIELSPLLIKFLKEFQPTAFSPLRIRDWGGRKPGYEKLLNTNLGSLRRRLRQLVASGQATTTISRTGNTLYRSAT